MTVDSFKDIFTSRAMEEILPPEVADRFFEALYGDVDEGAYDIRLEYAGFEPAARMLRFEIQLLERPGKCLACNLTYGLPEVFARHPLIDINGRVGKIEALLGGDNHCAGWTLGATRSSARNRHSIPLLINLA